MDTINPLMIDKAIITVRGICYQDMYYSCRIAIKENWFNPSSMSEKTSSITVVIEPEKNKVIAVISHTGIMHEVWKLQELLPSENLDYFEQINLLKTSIKEKKRKRQY